MEWSTWFRRRQRPGPDSRRQGEAYLGGTRVDGSAALPPPPYSVGDLPGVGLNVPTTAPTKFRMAYGQARQFDPDRRQRARNLVIGEGTSSEVYAAYNYLRTQIIQRLRENGWKTIAITSPSNAPGKTLTAVNLAISIARNFHFNVLLVELDLVNPSFRQILGFEERRGVVDHLLHDVPISEIMLSPGIDGLVVIPAGSPVTNSAELLSSSQMTRFIEEIRLRYPHHVVLFDLPSMLMNDDAMAFAPFVDCALLVIEEGETRIHDVRRAVDDLRATKILGVVLNHPDRGRERA
jgi:protein-tyrosine kinase